MMKMTKDLLRNRFNTLFIQQDDDHFPDDKYCDLPLVQTGQQDYSERFLTRKRKLLLHCL